MTTRVSIIQVRALLDAAEQAGAVGTDILSAARFEPKRVHAMEGWADVEEFDRLIEAAVRMSGDPAFGLHWGETTTGARYDVVAPVIGGAETLRKALAAMVRYQRILGEHDEVQISESAHALRLDYRPRATAEEALRVRKELAVVGFARLLRSFGGHKGVPLAVAFDYARPPHAAEYARIFEGREQFRQSWCGIEIPLHVLDMPQLGWNEELYRLMENHAEVALGEQNGTRSQGERIVRALHRAFPRWLDMSEVARELGMSERSLRRHLLREGVSFPALMTEAQREIAVKLLRDPARTVQQVAYDMGFSGPSAFHRAFKRWTGQTPSEFREAGKGGG